MSAEASGSASPATPLWGELRYSGELMRLLSDPKLRAPARREGAAPVLLIPGFMAGDASLALLRRWLRRRGHRVRMSGMLANVDCAGRALGRLQRAVRQHAADCGRPVVLIGQSRGGALARALAVREPHSVAGLVMLGAPVRDGLAVSPGVLRSLRLVAALGDLGLPGVLSSGCRDGECCAAFRGDLTAPLPPGMAAAAVHSRSDAIVDWRACMDPHAQSIEVDSSHCGMSVHPEVYRALEPLLDGLGEAAWNG